MLILRNFEKQFPMSNPGILYLIPNSLGSSEPDDYLPLNVKRLIPTLSCFIVEDLRNARRFLKTIDRAINIDSITFFELNKHTKSGDIAQFLDQIAVYGEKFV